MLSLVYAVYLPSLVAVLVWNAVAVAVALKRRPQTPALWRWLCAISAFASPIGLLCDAGSMTAETRDMARLAWLYPLSFALAAAAWVGTLRRTGLRWWMVTPALFNAVMAAVHISRQVLYAGVPLGAWAEGVTMGYAVLQTVLTMPFYIFFPVLNNLPVLPIEGAPDARWWRRLHTAVALPCGICALAPLAFSPRGVEVLRSWRSVDAFPQTAARADLHPGIVVRVPAAGPRLGASLTSAADEMHALGARAVNLFVHHTLMERQGDQAALDAFLRTVRAGGATVVMTADYPVAWHRDPPRTGSEALSQSRDFHAFLARRFRPDILVPFVEPYGAFVAVTGLVIPPAEWRDTLREASRAIRQSAPGVRVGAYLGQLEEDGALYALLCEPASEVDVVGFSLYSLYASRREMDLALRRMEGWIDRHGCAREHWLFEFGQSPVTMGGEAAQAGYLRWGLRWAAGRPEFRGAFVFSLRDDAEKLGLLSAHGRRRQAWFEFQRMAALWPPATR
ncbi:MAG TPA: hypothetical protein VLH79_12390 [Chthonomonadales bacterium]|nr:hypothetical protein [Chthonomonadales bacterium]